MIWRLFKLQETGGQAITEWGAVQRESPEPYVVGGLGYTCIGQGYVKLTNSTFTRLRVDWKCRRLSNSRRCWGSGPARG